MIAGLRLSTSSVGIFIDISSRVPTRRSTGLIVALWGHGCRSGSICSAACGAPAFRRCLWNGGRIAGRILRRRRVGTVVTASTSTAASAAMGGILAGTSWVARSVPIVYIELQSEIKIDTMRHPVECIWRLISKRQMIQCQHIVFIQYRTAENIFCTLCSRRARILFHEVRNAHSIGGILHAVNRRLLCVKRKPHAVAIEVMVSHC